MNTRLTLAVVVTAALLTLPLGAAEWTGRGFYEPDTARDETSNGIFLTPDVDPNPNTKKVYFSAFSAYYVLTPNHNVGTVGSNIMVYPTNMHAILGVWKDCNKDGYIGLPEGVAWDYLSVLLVDTSVCPATDPGDHNATGFAPVHNDGTWVREFIPVGPDYETGGADQGAEWQNNTNHYNIADEAARIWGDWGLPEDAAKASCPVNPRPQGTYQSTGGFLRFTDCLANWRITGTFNTVAHLAGQDSLAFDDAPQERPDQSASPLNQPNPWGQEDDASLVTAYDCNADPVVVEDPLGPQTVADPTGGQLTGDGPTAIFGEDGELTAELGETFVTYMPGAPGVNPAGSAAGTVNETVEEGAMATGGLDQAGSDFVFTGGAGATCDRDDDSDAGWSQGYAHIYGVDEAPFEGTTPKRSQTDVYYGFTEGNPEGTALTTDEAPGCLDDEIPETCAPIEDEDMPYRGWPDDLGLAVDQLSFGSGTWFGAPGYIASRNPYVNRDDLTPWGGVYFTTYAYVNPNLGLSLPGVVGTYGSPHCTGTTEITGGYWCSADKWWLNPDGSSLKTDWMVLPGQPYNLIDFDCYDASPVKNSPANTGLIGAYQCARP